MLTGRQAPSPGSLSVKKTLCQPCWRRNSVTSPSTQIEGSRATHEATPRLNAGDGVDLAVAVEERLDLHPSESSSGGRAGEEIGAL